MAKLLIRVAAWVVLALGIGNALRMFLQVRTLFGLVAGVVGLFVTIRGFLFLKRVGGKDGPGEVLAEPRDFVGSMPLAGMLRFPRLTVVPSEDGVVLSIPSTLGANVSGLYWASLPLLMLLYAIANYPKMQALGHVGLRIAGGVLVQLFMVVFYPWWWFLGGEEIELTPSSLKYAAGLPPFRRKKKTYEWSLIGDIRISGPRLMGMGYQVLFNYKPHLGLPQGVGRHLRTEEAKELIPLLQAYQRQVAETSSSEGSPVDAAQGRKPG